MTPAPEIHFGFVATHMFESSAKKLMTEEDRRQLELLLVEFARPSRGEGKSGGTRVIYYFMEGRDCVYLLLACSKNVKDDLTRAEESQLRKLGRALEGEG